MKNKIIFFILIVLFPFGFYFFFKNLKPPTIPQLRRLVAVEDQQNPPQNSIKINDTVWHTVPNFEFLGHTGKIVSNKNFENKIYIADFFFTTCPGICPKLTKQMHRIQAVYKNDNDVKLLSHTVDPARDSLPVLAQYAQRFEIDSTKWLLVTGNKKQLYDQARYGYYVSVTEGDGGKEDFIHTEKLVLIDKQKVIRGYYDGTDSVAVNKLLGDIKVLQLEYELQAKKAARENATKK